MKKIVILIVVYPLLVTSNLCAQNLNKNEVFDVLSKWQGKWKSIDVFEESVWVTKKSTYDKLMHQEDLIIYQIKKLKQ